MVNSTLDKNPVLADPTLDYDKLLDCIHCGFCLPTCPTYAVLGLEMDSPRGRVHLMRAVADGKIEVTENFRTHIDQCLGCRACETACPSGVRYGELVEHARWWIERHRPRSRTQRFLRRVAFRGLLPSPRRLALVFWPLWLYQQSGLQGWVRRGGFLRVLPGRLDQAEGFLPRLPNPRLRRHWTQGLIPAEGQRRSRVGLLRGCIADFMFADVNLATVRVLAKNGCEVVIPKAQTCCGALQAHNGDRETAIELARKNIDAFEGAEVDAIIVNAAGCGATMKEYGELLRHDPAYREKAKAFSRQVKDVTEFLAEIPLRNPLKEVRGKVAYHDACHLAHGQGIRVQPRKLLQAIPGVTLVPLKESDWCCGSAGIYNITQPELSMQLLERKMAHLAETGADIVAAANPGCLIQIRKGVETWKLNVEVVHPIELLDRAYRE